MRRFLTATLIATLLIGSVEMSPAIARPHASPCDGRAIRRTHPELGIPEVQRRVAHTIKCAERRFPVSGGAARAICIGRREGGLWPWSKNASGSWGTFQVIESTWQSWWRAYPLVRRWIKHSYHGDPAQIRLDPYAGVILAIRAMHDSLAPWAGGRYAC